MMKTEDFGKALIDFGFERFVGVPCSFLAPLINFAINENRFVMSNNEGDAVAIASGISLAQRQKFGVVLMQNSGLSNAMSPLTSLNYTFKIPILGFVSLRGEVGGIQDEPQHELMGKITEDMLSIAKIPHVFLSAELDQAKEQLKEALTCLKNKQSFFFIVKKGIFDSVDLTQEILPLQSSQKQNNFLMPQAKYQRIEILEEIDRIVKEKAIVLATTGKTGRELYEINDQQNYLYMVGSMGCVSSLGLGIAIESQSKVICIDGDGALLMRMGAMSTNAYYTKQFYRGNYCHILLDNHSHDSTGGQFSLAFNVDFPHIAAACGYEEVIVVSDLCDLQKALQKFLTQKNGGATFIYIRIKKGSKKNLGRPKITPDEVARRLEEKLR